MIKLKKAIMFPLVALVLSNCAPSQKEIISLPEKVQKEIGSTDVYLKECDKKMNAEIESSNLTTYTSGGLLFALIDCAIMSHREGCANDAMADMHKEVETFNFQEKFTSKLIHTLRSTNWLHVRQVNHIKEINKEKYEDIFKKATSDSILMSTFKYRLNPQFSVMTGTLHLTLYPASNKIKKMVKAEDPLETPIFKFHVSATEALPQAGPDIQENARLWTQNNASNLKKALDNIIHYVFISLEKVLKDPNHLPED